MRLLCTVSHCPRQPSVNLAVELSHLKLKKAEPVTQTTVPCLTRMRFLSHTTKSRCCCCCCVLSSLPQHSFPKTPWLPPRGASSPWCSAHPSSGPVLLYLLSGAPFTHICSSCGLSLSLACIYCVVFSSFCFWLSMMVNYQCPFVRSSPVDYRVLRSQ